MPSIFIEDNPLYHNKVKWVMQIISQYAHTTYEYVLDKNQSNISVGSSTAYDIKIDDSFFEKLKNERTKWKEILPDGPIYKNECGEESLLETIFYLVNCIQEMNPDPEDIDHYGRFKYSASLQFHYGIIEENFVGHLIDQLILQFPILSLDGNLPQVKSKFYISHDIDILLSGWKIEGYLALKQFKWGLLLKVIWDTIRRKPFYNNIDQVIELDKKNGITPCFYWLASHGKDPNGIMNADYTIEDLNIQCQKVKSHGFESGIHKSSFETTFHQEIAHFPFKVEHNRYHFLKFQTHSAWKEIEAAGLKTDASLGFAEHIGFRNSYGLPFVPFDVENDRPYSFVEIPLHVMDVTLMQYMGLNAETADKRLRMFTEKNKNQCILSVLWHNNSFSNYQKDLNTLFEGYVNCFKVQDLYNLGVNKIFEDHQINDIQNRVTEKRI